MNIRFLFYAIKFVVLFFYCCTAFSIEDVMSLSLEDLMQESISSVTKSNKKISEAPASAYVLSSDKIQQSGVKTVADALLMIPGVQVSRIYSNVWAISIRGFQQQYSNKLLVMVDGISLYRSTFSGIFWDLSDVIVENIKRIEVIRGPGSVMWGANAVNGVINIITKDTMQTEGVLVGLQLGGDHHRALFRHGSILENGDSWRYDLKSESIEHLQGVSLDAQKNMTFLPQSIYDDSWNRSSMGFRFDHTSSTGKYIISGDYKYIEQPDISLLPTGNALYNSSSHLSSRWEHPSESGTFQQVYVTSEQSDAGALGQGEETVIDWEGQKQYQWKNHLINVGGGYRQWFFTYQPGIYYFGEQDIRLWHTTLHDEWRVTDRFTLFSGARFDSHHIYDESVHPSIRATYQLDRLLWWAALSKAYRNPSRLENSSLIQVTYPQAIYRFVGNFKVEPEALTAYEVGVRHHYTSRFYWEMNLFQHSYDHLIGLTETFSLSSLGVPLVIQSSANESEQEVAGTELLMAMEYSNHLTFEVGYSYQNYSKNHQAGMTDFLLDSEPAHSRWNLNMAWRFMPNWFLHTSLVSVSDATAVYYDQIRNALSTVDVHDYINANVRVAHNLHKNWEVAFLGKDLFHQNSPEFYSYGVNLSPAGTISASYAIESIWRF